MIIPDISLETSLWKEGYEHVAGVDEAGKGPWAGPVTAAAVVIHSAKQIVPVVRDSKKMTKIQREKAFDLICGQSSAFGIGIVSAEDIDTIGIQAAVKKAMLLALQETEQKLGNSISYVLVDGSKTAPLPTYLSRRIKAGDLYHYSIAAGSVLAKVTRDRIMHALAKLYPLYGFDKHVGYGTTHHIQALTTYGPCPIHRKSFAPIKALLKQGYATQVYPLPALFL